MVVTAHAAAGVVGSHIHLRRLQRLLEALQQANPAMLVGITVLCGIMCCTVQHSATMAVPALNCRRAVAAINTASTACGHGFLRNKQCAKLRKLVFWEPLRVVHQLICFCSLTTK
jgi:hypothetical protein